MDRSTSLRPSIAGFILVSWLRYWSPSAIASWFLSSSAGWNGGVQCGLSLGLETMAVLWDFDAKLGPVSLEPKQRPTAPETSSLFILSYLFHLFPPWQCESWGDYFWDHGSVQLHPSLAERLRSLCHFLRHGVLGLSLGHIVEVLALWQGDLRSVQMLIWLYINSLI